MTVGFIKNDGGRSAAGYKSTRVRDCVVRAVTIATNGNYKTIYDEVNAAGESFNGRKNSARIGMEFDALMSYMIQKGFEYVPMKLRGPMRVRLNELELAAGSVVVDVAGHAVACIDGVLHDSFDCRQIKYGGRIVRGYWKQAN